MQELQKYHRFEMLDIIRGIAALMVAVRHLSRDGYSFYGMSFLGSYLAVDIFFMLSGFVLAHAYEPQLATGGLRVPKFFTIRVIRIYPFYLLATLLGLIAVFAHSQLAQIVLPPHYFLYVTGLAVFLLPYFGWVPLMPRHIYPLDNPSWTLFPELMANLFHAILAPCLSNRLLNAIILGFGVTLVYATFHNGTVHIGFRTANYAAGFARVGFSYFLGVRLYRLWQSRVNHWKATTGIIIVGMFGLLFMPLTMIVLFLPYPYYDLLAILLVIPALIYFAASVEVGRWGRKFLLPLGTVSYGYYVLHVPFAMACWAAADLVGYPAFHTVRWNGFSVLIALVFITLGLDRYYDVPLRKWLVRRFVGRIKGHRTEA